MLFSKNLSIFSIVLMISGCSFFQSAGDWPEPLPAQNYFVDYYELKADNQLYQEQESYLAWVKIFYFGNALSLGWIQLTEELLDKTPVYKQQEYAELMAEIGQLISAEWSLSNRTRLIDTRSASVWRDALAEAISADDLDNYLQRFNADVNSILAGSLSKEDIEFSRYYEEELFEFI
jgi:hypothetical protein